LSVSHVLECSYTGATGFCTPVTVDARATDAHGNTKRKELSGPDTFGQAAGEYARFPANPGKGGFVAWMGFSSGTSTVARGSVAGVAEMISNPIGYAEQMAQLGTTIANNPAILTKFPELMAAQLRDQHETRNPFDPHEQYYQEFGGGWSLGYTTGTVAPAAASGGPSFLQKGLSSSSKLRRVVNTADSAVPDRVPNGAKPTALRRAGKVDNAVPDVDENHDCAVSTPIDLSETSSEPTQMTATRLSSGCSLTFKPTPPKTTATPRRCFGT
jgi:hypothetical protein